VRWWGAGSRRTRWIVFWIGLAASIGVTALLWWLKVPGGALLLLFPFFWFPFGKRWESAAGVPGKRCPQCGWTAAGDEDRFCPRDGTRLG
jgi:hypothetical protein